MGCRFVAVTAAVGLVLFLLTGSARADRDGKIARDGFDLYYHSVGQGEPIVLLSGGPGMDADFLRPVADELSHEYECVLLEQRGTGRSRLKTVTPATANLKLYIDDLEALRENLHQPKLTLLGNSWGMVLALAYGAAHPDRVRAIVTMGSGPIAASYFTCFNDNIKMRLRPEDVDAMQKARQNKDKERGEWERLKAILPGYFFDRDKALRYAPTVRPDGFNSSINGVVMGALRKEHFDLRPTLRRLTAPVLLIQGRQDPAGEGNLYETKMALPNARMVFLDKCGHLPWAEQPERAYRACREFLSQIYNKPANRVTAEKNEKKG